MKFPDARCFRWDLVTQALTCPYSLRLSTVLPVILLLLIVPVYIFIGVLWTPFQTLHAPELALDRALPLQPAWTVIYGSYLILIVLPLLVVRQEGHIRRTALAYLMVWSVAYLCFLAYPTIAPRPTRISSEGFFVWTLRIVYSSDPKYNCFPSLHVAHSFVSALSCYRIHRGVGIATGFWAFLIGISTLYTKQHYIADVLGGVFLAYVAWVIFLRNYPPEAIPESDRRVAPVLALSCLTFYGLVIVGFWIAYQISRQV